MRSAMIINAISHILERMMIAAYLRGITSSCVHDAAAHRSSSSASGDVVLVLFLNLKQLLACCVATEADMECVWTLGTLRCCCRVGSSVNSLS